MPTSADRQDRENAFLVRMRMRGHDVGEGDVLWGVALLGARCPRCQHTITENKLNLRMFDTCKAPGTRPT